MASSEEKVDQTSKVETDYEKSGIDEKSVLDEERIKIDANTGIYDGVQRNMKQRHIQMIALAGVCPIFFCCSF
jgi:amino acid permease